MTPSPHVFEVTTRDFDQRVLEASRHVPVLVDFWADWCAPCRTLMPVLSALAEEYQGRFLLAKVNTDTEQELAARYGVRSLPTVKLFYNGEAVDEFMGAQPEGVVRELLERYLPRASDELRLAAREHRERGDREEALRLLEKALADDPQNYRIHPELLDLQMELGRFADARALLSELPADKALDPPFTTARDRLEFAEAAGDADPAELERRVAADPGDLEARHQLAARAVLEGRYETALEHLLEVMRRDRGFKDDAGRRGMVAVFEMLGNQGALVSRYRGLMSSALY